MPELKAKANCRNVFGPFTCAHSHTHTVLLLCVRLMVLVSQCHLHTQLSATGFSKSIHPAALPPVLLKHLNHLKQTMLCIWCCKH